MGAKNKFSWQVLPRFFEPATRLSMPILLSIKRENLSTKEAHTETSKREEEEVFLAAWLSMEGDHGDGGLAIP